MSIAPAQFNSRPNRAAAVLASAVMGLAMLLAHGIRPAAAQEQITLNLEDAQLSALVDTVAEVTGRNFVIDPRVNAKVTVVSRRPMNADALYEVFLSILQVHGFSAIPSGEVTKIVPNTNARQLGSEDGTAGGDSIVTRVIAVDNVPVSQLVPILRPLVPQQGHFAAYPPTNVLIISDHARNVQRLAGIIRDVDRQGVESMEVVRLKHATAGEMDSLLGDLRGQQGQGSAGTRLRVAADDRTNSLILAGPKEQRQRVRQLIERLDKPREGGGDTRVVYLSYGKAADVAKVLQGVVENLSGRDQGGGQGSGGAKAQVSIQPDEATNSLVISAPPNIQQELGAVIEKLDVRRAQVVIEAAIAEISADTAAELGFQWAVDGSESGNTGVGISNFNNTSVSGGSSLAGIISSVQQDQLPNVGQGLNLAIADLTGGVQFAALLRALASDADTNILSTPSLVTLDNQEAEINVAQEVPFLTGQFSETGDGGSDVNPFQTIERKDVGIILKVTPQINEGNSVLLDIEQEVSSVSQSTQAVDLITDKRSINTTVLVDSGRLIVLGGLIDEQVRETEQRVPLLGSIPVLGNLFRFRTSESEKRNLMVFLRPRIVRDEETMSRYASKKYQDMRQTQKAQREKGVGMLPDHLTPVLPPLSKPELPPPFTASAE